METEKNILTEVLDISMKSQDESEGEKVSLDAFLEDELNLKRRSGESEKDYHERLLAIQATQAGLISAYEAEKDLERMSEISRDFKSLLANGSYEDEIYVRRKILRLSQEVKTYLKDYRHLSNRENVKEKITGLISLT